MHDQHDKPHNHFCGRTRREFLWQSGGSFTSLALASLLGSDGFLQRQAVAFDGVTPLNPPGPFAQKQKMIPGRAKSVIFFFCYGGPSHVEGTGRRQDRRTRGGTEVEVPTTRRLRRVGLGTLPASLHVCRRHFVHQEHVCG